MSRAMRRRDFLNLLGGVATAWPAALRAQPGKVARTGMLSGGTTAGTRDRDKCLDDGLRALG